MIDILESARRKLAVQAADLANKTPLSELDVANLLLECGTAVALSVVDPERLAAELRARADDLERLDGSAALDS